MKKILKRLSIVGTALVFVLLTMISLTSCDLFNKSTTYTATSGFYWSSDAGATYKSGTKEYEVGENVYMQLIVKVDSTRNKNEEVGVTLTIPYIQDVVSKYFDGQVITPEVDELNHTTTYNFTVIASKNASESKFVFKFIPTKATDITLKLEFDDKISDIYDKQNTITFTEKTSE